MLQVENLGVQYGPHVIVEGASFTVEEGQWLMIIGPNGAGKSTLISAISQGAAHTGCVRLDGENIAKWKPQRLAQNMGVLLQHNNPSYSFSVEEVVRLGRYAYSQGVFGGTHQDDEAKVEEALRDTGMDVMRHQSVLTLSGGELQRTFLAQLLAQDPKLLILDEPANHLDLVYQKQVFDLVGQWVKKSGRAAISVVHDLSLAKAYGTHAMMMHKGKVAALGPITTVMCEKNLREVYSIDVYGWMRTMLGQWEKELAAGQ
ncbi:ABC transporter ATP-binding protein [Clostridia bacterium OttesenSCG-928-O13]|nr:ABC transporter ATP-binding protein [Clostridia bacterium OttesenSCG-928-O13]